MHVKHIQTDFPTSTCYVQNLKFLYIFILQLVNSYYLGCQLSRPYLPSLYNTKTNISLSTILVLSLKRSSSDQISTLYHHYCLDILFHKTATSRDQTHDRFRLGNNLLQNQTTIIARPF